MIIAMEDRIMKDIVTTTERLLWAITDEKWMGERISLSGTHIVLFDTGVESFIYNYDKRIVHPSDIDEHLMRLIATKLGARIVNLWEEM